MTRRQAPANHAHSVNVCLFSSWIGGKKGVQQDEPGLSPKVKGVFFLGFILLRYVLLILRTLEGISG